ncbi:MAG TPA: galactokinase [Vicinamibacteria bacterium]|nr:galactokinase [Vicinamibacteria bacterium]
MEEQTPIARRVAQAFRERFGGEPRVAVAPGRVNLMGEHTDYNDGFVLPVAIDRHVVVAFSPNPDHRLRGYSLDLDDEGNRRLDEPRPRSDWLDYVAGVAWSLQQDGISLDGMNLVVGADLPMGAGLGSSAALELAAARAFMADRAWDAERAAEQARRAENDFVGVPCGIMDQMSVALSEPGHGLLIDCRGHGYTRIPLPEDIVIVVLDTATRRALREGRYQERRASCERAASLLGVKALRDATREEMERLPEALRRLALHVSEENERTCSMAEALAGDDRASMSELMARSHASLRDGFEVSTPALDRMVEIASAHPRAIGARMTGAGFGGCAVALVAVEGVESFVAEVGRAYAEDTGRGGVLFACRPSGGARVVE